ncbi:GGDEF domain-containing protein [Aureimonas sp. SK2]|uniref:GGDEF domain-containing protein n=1 Tax=Aureimonas sp. SK2 TaxID=3015992 RepID=UPI002444D7DB|nr:diguanylate cyclase [Aureimonas sp. SK2]
MSKINVDLLAVPAFSVEVTDDGILRYDGINVLLCQLSGFTKEVFVGKTAAEFMSFEGARAWEANYRRCLATAVMDEYEELAETPAGLRWWRTILVPVVQDGGKIVQLLGIAADINERKRAEESLQWAAFSDPITAIGNRRRFDLDLAAAMARSMDSGRPFALVLADIDCFKSINDTFGHDVGDEVLRQTAARLRAGVREKDKIARIGGDEFAAILSSATEGAVAVALDRIERQFVDLMDCGRTKVRTGVSVGAALWRVGMSADELRRSADAAMYEAKRRRAA